MLDWKKKLKFAAITAAFAVLILIVLSNVVKMTQVSEKDIKTYKQGLYYAKTKEEADDLVKKLEKENIVVFRYWNNFPDSYIEKSLYTNIVSVPI